MQNEAQDALKYRMEGIPYPCNKFKPSISLLHIFSFFKKPVKLIAHLYHRYLDFCVDDRVEDILMHEFSHGVHLVGVMPTDKTFDQRLKAQYNAARSAGLWRNTYAMTDHHEYWVSLQPSICPHFNIEIKVVCVYPTRQLMFGQ